MVLKTCEHEILQELKNAEWVVQELNDRLYKINETQNKYIENYFSYSSNGYSIIFKYGEDSVYDDTTEPHSTDEEEYENNKIDHTTLIIRTIKSQLLQKQIELEATLKALTDVEIESRKEKTHE